MYLFPRSCAPRNPIFKTTRCRWTVTHRSTLPWPAGICNTPRLARLAEKSCALAAGHHCTVRVALVLITLPALSLTITAKRAPLSAGVVGGVL